MTPTDLRTTTIRRVDAPEWRAASRRFLDFNYRMLWEYADSLAREYGATSERVVVERDGEPIGLAEVRVRALPLGAGGVAYLSGGPAVRRTDATDEQRLEGFRATMDALEREYVRRRKLTLRALCPIGAQPWNDSLGAALRERGYQPVADAPGYRTIMIDTARTLDDINASLNKTWRKYLRRAERDGVTVRRATDREAFEHVIRLHDSLRERKGFGVALDGGFYADLQDSLPDEDKMIVILAELGSEVVGMNLVSAQGDTLSGIIGASTREGADKNAAYLLEWEAVRIAVERRLAWYDLGGIDPERNPGVYTFKKGTHGEDLTSAGPLELDPGAIRGAIRRSSERAYKAIRKRKVKS